MEISLELVEERLSYSELTNWFTFFLDLRFSAVAGEAQKDRSRSMENLAAAKNILQVNALQADARKIQIIFN